MKEINSSNQLTTTTQRTISIKSTTNFESHFEGIINNILNIKKLYYKVCLFLIIDLSNWTLFFGYSFKKIAINFNINLLPTLSSIWFRTNYTANIRVLFYNSFCINVTILTNENSRLTNLFQFYPKKKKK